MTTQARGCSRQGKGLGCIQGFQLCQMHSFRRVDISDISITNSISNSITGSITSITRYHYTSDISDISITPQVISESLSSVGS